MAYYHSSYGSPKKKNGKGKRIFFFFLLFLLLVAAGAGYWLYNIVLKPNVWTPNNEAATITIPTGSDYEDVKNILYSQGLIIHRQNFEWLAEKKKYPETVKPGRYLIDSTMSNNDLINLLRSGEQLPVQLIFNNIRDIYQLAETVSLQIEADSASIVHLLTDSTYLSLLGFEKRNSIYFVYSKYLRNVLEYFG